MVLYVVLIRICVANEVACEKAGDILSLKQSDERMRDAHAEVCASPQNGTGFLAERVHLVFRISALEKHHEHHTRL